MVFFSLLTKCVLLCISSGHKSWSRAGLSLSLKKYFTKSLDKYFMNNNHHLDFLQGLFSASGIETAFSLKKVAKYAKNRFSWLPWKRKGCHEHLLVPFKNKDVLYIHFYKIAVKSIRLC